MFDGKVKRAVYDQINKNLESNTVSSMIQVFFDCYFGKRFTYTNILAMQSRLFNVLNSHMKSVYDDRTNDHYIFTPSYNRELLTLVLHFAEDNGITDLKNVDEEIITLFKLTVLNN